MNNSSKMKVLLIVSSFGRIYGSYKRIYKRGFLNPPLNLCYLASSIERNGHTAKIVDAEAEGLSIIEILNIAKFFKPDLIGITATSVDFDGAVPIIKMLKQKMPDVPIIIGGTHISIFENEVLEQIPEIDYGCIGDGEDLILELIDTMLQGNNEEIDNIKGLIYRKDGKIIQNSSRPMERDLDRYEFPARHLLKNELYFRSIPYYGYKTTASFMSSRGCPYKCVYCAAEKIRGGSQIRLRSVENVIEELEYIVNELGITHVAFNDDCLTINKNRIYEICEEINSRGLKFTWEGLSRADLVEKELLLTMKKTGFVRMSYGVESGDPNILRVLQKGETLDQIESAFSMTKEAGIITRGSIIIGSPYETRETVENTFQFVRNLKGIDQVVINVLQPYPGTKARDMIISGEGGSRYIKNEGDYGYLQRFGKASISVNDLTPESLVFLQKWGFMRFYLRPKVIWNNFKITGFKVFLQDGFNFVRSIAGI